MIEHDRANRPLTQTARVREDHHLGLVLPALVARRPRRRRSLRSRGSGRSPLTPTPSRTTTRRVVHGYHRRGALRAGVATAAGEMADPLPAAACAPLSHTQQLPR